MVTWETSYKTRLKINFLEALKKVFEITMVKREQIRNQLGNQLGNKFGYQLRVQLWYQLWYQLGEQLGNKFGWKIKQDIRDYNG